MSNEHNTRLLTTAAIAAMAMANGLDVALPVENPAFQQKSSGWQPNRCRRCISSKQTKPTKYKERKRKSR